MVPKLRHSRDGRWRNSAHNNAKITVSNWIFVRLQLKMSSYHVVSDIYWIHSERKACVEISNMCSDTNTRNFACESISVLQREQLWHVTEKQCHAVFYHQRRWHMRWQSAHTIRKGKFNASLSYIKWFVFSSNTYLNIMLCIIPIPRILAMLSKGNHYALSTC